MEEIMAYEAFEEAYMNAVRSGTDMLCVWWTEDGNQVQMSWHPHTADIHDQLAFEADMLMKDEEVEAVADWDMAFDEAFDAYHDALCDAAKDAYDRYREELGEDDDA